jgi:predicted ABC-type ATPase
LTTLAQAVAQVLEAQRKTKRPLAIVLAGHNGSGKSTMWRRSLAGTLQIPLVNADRMMLSILPEPGEDGHLPGWAATLRDTDRGWMGVAQQGVNAFVGHAMGAKVPFAMETVFSYWEELPDGRVLSKIDLIKEMQVAGYFVLLFFVGLASPELSVLRVATRVTEGGHGIDEPTLRKRFPRTQRAISEAVKVADASILTDNSRGRSEAFEVCRVQLGQMALYDVRIGPPPPPQIIAGWMNSVVPLDEGEA